MPVAPKGKAAEAKLTKPTKPTKPPKPTKPTKPTKLKTKSKDNKPDADSKVVFLRNS